MVDYLQRIRDLSVDTAHGQRAPYKALLLIWMIGRLHSGGSPSVAFAEAEEPLEELLEAYSIGTGQKPIAHLPFVHLASDSELWRVRDSNGSDIYDMDANTRRRRKFLRQEAIGEITPGFADYLANSQHVISVVSHLLEDTFPQTTHEGILEVVELPDAAAPTPHRDPSFKPQLLLAYESRCSFCGFDGRISDKPVGLDAAHIKMHSQGGPDIVSNGLLLCALHHRLFDRGVMSISTDLEILVSQHYVENQTVHSSSVVELVGNSIHPPQGGFPTPAPEFATWHYENLFRGPSRVTT
jgi:putative restriction endonuclease